MAYYSTCPSCGSNLDPGEKCTCMEKKVRHQDYFSRYLRVAEAGQLAFTFDAEMVEDSKTDRREIN